MVVSVFLSPLPLLFRVLLELNVKAQGTQGTRGLVTEYSVCWVLVNIWRKRVVASVKVELESVICSDRSRGARLFSGRIGG